MKHSILITCLCLLFCACINGELPAEKKVNSQLTISYEAGTVPCGWKKEVMLDTSYNGIAFKIQIQCQAKINYIDTVDQSDSVKTIRYWNDIEYLVNSSLFDQPLVIEKSTYKDSLVSDMLYNSFLSPPNNFMFNANDSSLTFENFIGHADSDVGDLYVLRIDKTGKTQVLSVRENLMGEED